MLSVLNNYVYSQYRCDTTVEMNSSADISNSSASDSAGEGDLESTSAV